MRLLKRFEWVAKIALALAAAVLLWRPKRRTRGSLALGQARNILLVRIDDRLGEALLMTPLFGLIKRAAPNAQVHALLHPSMAPVLSGHRDLDRVIAFDARWLFLGVFAPGIRALRREAYDAVFNCANWTEPSVRSALVSRLIGAKAAVVGPTVWPVTYLYSISVKPRPETRNELEQRVHLLSPLLAAPGGTRLSFDRPRVSARLKPLLEKLGSTPYAIVNPGGRLDWRRIPPAVFSAAARTLIASGLRPVITWGPGEASVAKSVAELAPGSIVAPSTDVHELAGLFSSARLTVCNNTGPMHLSVAVGTPTLALFLKMDPERWGHPYPPHRMVDLTPSFEDGEDIPSIVQHELTQFLQRLRREHVGSAPQSTLNGE